MHKGRFPIWSFMSRSASASGKSNLVEAFHFLRQVYRQNLQTYTGQAGGANKVLHYGRKQTPILSICVEFSISSGG